jgi:hypothetical protein
MAFPAVPLRSSRLAQPPDDPAQAAALGRGTARRGRRGSRRRRRFGRGRGIPARFPFVARRAARWPPTPPPSGRPSGPFRLGDRGGWRGDWRGLGQRPSGARRAAPSAPAAGGGCPAGSRGTCRRGLQGALALRREQAAPDLGSHLALGAQRAVGSVDVDPPDDDRGRRPADRGPFLRQRPASVDRVAGMHRAGKLPVEPLPLLDRRHGHVDRAQADRDRDQERGRRQAGVARGGFDR